MSPAQGRSAPITVVENARIYTMDRARPVARALAFRDGHIVAIGSSEEVEQAAGPTARRIDLGGLSVLPGMIDAHIHALAYSRSLKRVNLEGVKSKEEALRMVAEKASGAEPGAWVIGGGWNNNLWSPNTFPTREDLDRIAPNNPVYLDRKDLHSCWVNTRALELAGITREMPDPPGAAIGRDEQGEPNGLLFERAVGIAIRAIREQSDTPVNILREGLKMLASMGITGFHNCQGQDRETELEGKRAFSAMQELDGQGELTARVISLLPKYDLDSAIRLGLRTGFGSERLRIGPVKMFSDGALGSVTADMLEPYETRPGYRGLSTMTQSELEETIIAAAEAGIPSAIHAIGDAANRRVLDAFSYARTKEPKGGPRLIHRIEHAQITHPDDIPRFAQLGVVASMQPIHATSDMYAADRLWGARARYSYAWRSLLDAGALVAFGSDAPVETPDPLLGIHAAVTRQNSEDEPAEGWYPQERISVEEAVRAYTESAAQSAPYLPGVTGTLSVGAVADFVVLDRDIFNIDPREIKDARVLATAVGGNAVYNGGDLFPK